MSNYVKYCAACAHFDDRCTCQNGLLYGIRISESMADAEHDCPVFKERIYRLSEASHLLIAMEEEGLRVEFKTAKAVCDRFLQRLVEAGLLEKEGGEQ